jgi:hypothetical protein
MFKALKALVGWEAPAAKVDSGLALVEAAYYDYGALMTTLRVAVYNGEVSAEDAEGKGKAVYDALIDKYGFEVAARAISIFHGANK